MLKQLKITPKFNVKEIINDTIKKDWFIFQAEAYEMGNTLLLYMQSYINSNRKRSGNTGNLAKSMTFEGTTGAGFISWGIGNISLLQTRAPYWYVINYGKKITGEDFIPPANVGYFGQGEKPDSKFAGSKQKGLPRWHRGGGKGTGFFMKPTHVVRAMNYISATRLQLDINFKMLLNKLKRGF